MARQQRFDWFSKTQLLRRKARPGGRRQKVRLRRTHFELLEPRTMLSANGGLSDYEIATGTSFTPHQHGDHVHDVWGHTPHGSITNYGFVEEEPDDAVAAVGDDPPSPGVLTVILDFIDPGQEDGTDWFGNVVTTFDVVDLGFEEADRKTLEHAILEDVRSDYYDIATSDIFELSAIPFGKELNIQFEIGELGEPPVNGSNEFYYIQIGHIVDGPCEGALGCAGLSFMRTSAGESGRAEVGDVFGSIFAEGFSGIGSSGMEVAANTIGFVISHEAGHSLSLAHVAKEGSITPNELVPIMGTGAIDLTGEDFMALQGQEFSYFGRNPEQENRAQFHLKQLVDAVGLTDAGTGPRDAIFVDIATDEFDVDVGNPDIELQEGDLSLREAIFFATLEGRRRKVEFRPDLVGSTITLDPSLGSFVVDGPVVIEGLGADKLTLVAPTVNESLDLGGEGQIFVIAYNDEPEIPTASVSISGMTLVDAASTSDGGTIYSEHKLELDNVNIMDSSSTGRGGAIYATDKVSITRSALLDNEAVGDGGAVFVNEGGGIELHSTTISGNRSDDEGGAIGIKGEGSRIEINSSTISGNDSVGDGGALHVVDENPAEFVVRHSTIFDNHSATGSGGGIYLLNGVATLEHTIVAGNTDIGEAPDIDNINLASVPSVIARYSLVGNNKGASIFQNTPNIIGNAADPVDPMLGDLADNGGVTPTHLPQPGSPALDNGSVDLAVVPDFDQRGVGFKRVAFGVIDIGAVESGGFQRSFTVDTAVDENDGDYSAGDLSLREAIHLASIEAGRDLINFWPTLSGQTILLDASLGELVIDTPMAIDASDLVGGISIDASLADPTPLLKNGDGMRVLRIDDGSAAEQMDIELLGLSLAGGDVTGDGGAIHSLEKLTLQNVIVTDNGATQHGGGIFHRGGAFVLENSAVINNRAGDSGGGFYHDTSITGEATGRVTNATFSGNFAGDEGGGIFNFDGLLEIEHATITNNEADKGGGVVSFGDAATETRVYSSIIAGNIGFDVEKSRNLAHNSFVSEFYNLIGIGNALLAFDENPVDLIEVTDPMLEPLANNGGNTWTHVPQVGSPAIDASDPAFVVEVGSATEFDQRGEGFSRVLDGDNDETAVLDIGALEVPPPKPNADFDDNGSVDGADFLAWQRGYGTSTGASTEDGDSDKDGDVDRRDLLNWEGAFGFVSPEAYVAEILLPSPQTPNVSVETATVRVEPQAPTIAIKRDSANKETQLVSLAARSSLFALLDDGEESEDASEAQMVFGMPMAELPRTEIDLDSAGQKRGQAASPFDENAPEDEDHAIDFALETLADFGLRSF